jgi:hypothetical protein
MGGLVDKIGYQTILYQRHGKAIFECCFNFSFDGMFANDQDEISTDSKLIGVNLKIIISMI